MPSMFGRRLLWRSEVILLTNGMTGWRQNEQKQPRQPFAISRSAPGVWCGVAAEFGIRFISILYHFRVIWLEMLNIIATLKSGLEVIRKLKCNFLFAFYSNYMDVLVTASYSLLQNSRLFIFKRTLKQMSNPKTKKFDRKSTCWDCISWLVVSIWLSIWKGRKQQFLADR